MCCIGVIGLSWLSGKYFHDICDVNSLVFEKGCGPERWKNRVVCVKEQGVCTRNFNCRFCNKNILSESAKCNFEPEGDLNPWRKDLTLDAITILCSPKTTATEARDTSHHESSETTTTSSR